MNDDNFLIIIFTIPYIVPIILFYITIIIRLVIPNKYGDIIKPNLITDTYTKIKKKTIHFIILFVLFVIFYYIPMIYIVSNTILLLYTTYISISIALDINILIKKNLKLAIVSSIFFAILFWLSESFFYEINNNLIFGITGYSADNFPLASNLLLCNDMLMALAIILWTFISCIVMLNEATKVFDKKTKIKSWLTILIIPVLTFKICCFIFEDFSSTQSKYAKLTEKILQYTFILPEDYLNRLPNKSLRSKGYFIIYNFTDGEKLHILNNGNVLVYKPPERSFQNGRFYTFKVNHLPYNKASYARINHKTGHLQKLK